MISHPDYALSIAKKLTSSILIFGIPESTVIAGDTELLRKILASLWQGVLTPKADTPASVLRDGILQHPRSPDRCASECAIDGVTLALLRDIWYRCAK